MKSARIWLKDSFHLAVALLRTQGFAVLALFLFSTALNFTAEDALQLMAPSQETERLACQLGLGIWELIEGILIVLILSWGIPKVRTQQNPEILAAPFATPYLGSFLAEYLRMLAQILMWGLLLLIPGFVRYWQLIFVPFVALFSRSYREGKVDALRVSEKLSSGRLPMIAGIVIVSMGLEAGLEFLPELLPVLHNYVIRGLLAAVGYGINVWSFAFFYLFFEKHLTAFEEPA